jgi:sulfoxide reductase heme-binding subunit YedZ
MVRRLGYPRWQRLHRLAYVASTLGAIHFIWRVKKDLTEPATYAAILAVLLAFRVVDALRSRRGKRKGKAARRLPETEATPAG